jgi:hypothetical protein
MHKLLHGVGEIDINDWFSKNVGNTVTRARSDPLNVLSQNGTLEMRRNFFTYRVVSDWNAVPTDIKNLTIPGQFKKAHRRWQRDARDEALRGNRAQT